MKSARPLITPVRLLALVVIVAASLWMAFHPPMKIDASELDTRVMKQVESLGFRSVFRPIQAEYKGSETLDVVQDYSVQLSVTPNSGSLTERRSSRTYARHTLEGITLTSGVVPLLAIERARPPLVWSLLPYTFWGKSKLSALEIIENRDFPTKKGGALKLLTTYDTFLTDGTQRERNLFSLTCYVESIEPASRYFKTLSGEVAQIGCEEKTLERRKEPGGEKMSDEIKITNKKVQLYFLETHLLLWKSGSRIAEFEGQTQTETSSNEISAARLSFN